MCLSSEEFFSHKGNHDYNFVIFHLGAFFIVLIYMYVILNNL